MDDLHATTGTLFSPLTAADLEALLWQSRRPYKPSAWHGHVAFAHWLVPAARPRLLVELGTEHGVSYASFCHAVAAGKLATHCVSVDTWQGDEHTGGYGEEVYADLKEFNDRHYGGFSRLLRRRFDEALPNFADGSIDLLHIDGLHTYDAVRHDFETWAPKLSDRAVVLFHDTEIRTRDFGVWQLWAELRARYPSFSFAHSAGLGVLCVGRHAPAKVAALCAMTGTEDVARIRECIVRFSGLAQGSARQQGDLRVARQRLETLSAAVQQAQTLLAAATP